jgi:alpha-beta hydrolase superfamily lysophospholipase
LLRAEGAGPPFDVVGHSMGGLLAIGLVREPGVRFRRCVLSAPFLGPAHPLPRWKLRAGRLAARLWPTLRFSLGLDAEDLLRDPGEQDLWRRDPLRRAGIGARAGAALLDEAALRAAESLPLGLPCLVLVASDDRVADPSLARDWASRCGAACVELAGLRHEIWREPEGALAGMALERFLLADARGAGCGL